MSNGGRLLWTAATACLLLSAGCSEEPSFEGDGKLTALHNKGYWPEFEIRLPPLEATESGSSTYNIAILPPVSWDLYLEVEIDGSSVDEMSDWDRTFKALSAAGVEVSVSVETGTTHRAFSGSLGKGGWSLRGTGGKLYWQSGSCSSFTSCLTFEVEDHDSLSIRVEVKPEAPWVFEGGAGGKLELQPVLLGGGRRL